MLDGNNKMEDFKKSGEILYLPCNKLLDHPLHFDFYIQSHLEGLVLSIRETGLLEPVVVCLSGDDAYRILSGHYRIRAARRLLWNQVLCRVVKCDDRLSAIIYCTSNLLSRGLSAIEEAYMISGLVTEEKFTMTEVGKLWGRSKSWVSRRLGLLTHLDPKVRKEIEKGFLNPRVAQELARLPQGNDQQSVLKIIRREHMNKDKVGEFVTWWLSASHEEQQLILHKSIFKESKSPCDILERSVSNHISDSTQLLVKLVSIANDQTTIDWWPMDKYDTFKKAFIQLDHIIKKQSVKTAVEV